MSRTFRETSHRMKKFYRSKVVRDGTPTRVSHFCTNHGGCPYCLGNKMHKHVKKMLKMRQQMLENELRGLTRGSKKGA